MASSPATATAGATAPGTNGPPTVDTDSLANEFAKTVIDGKEDKLNDLLNAAVTIDDTDKFFQETTNTPDGSRKLAKELDAQLEKDFPNTSNMASSTYGHLPEIAKLDEEIKVFQKKLMNVEKELQDEGLLTNKEPEDNTATATVTDSSEDTASATNEEQEKAEPVYKSDNEDENKEMEDNETDPDKCKYADEEDVKADPKWRASASSHAHDAAYRAAMKIAKKHGKCMGVHDPEGQDWVDPLDYEEEELDPELDYCMECRSQDVDKSSRAWYLMQCYAKNPETKNKPFGCKGWVHPYCVGLQEAPKGDWVCYDCVMEEHDFFSNSDVGKEGISFRPHTIPGYKTSSDEEEQQAGSDGNGSEEETVNVGEEETINVRQKQPYRSARRRQLPVVAAHAQRHKKVLVKTGIRHTKVQHVTSTRKRRGAFSDDEYNGESDDSSASEVTVHTTSTKKKKKRANLETMSRQPAPSVASKPTAKKTRTNLETVSLKPAPSVASAATAFTDAQVVITPHAAKKTLKEDSKRNAQREENKTLPRGSGGNNAGTFPKSNTQCMDIFVRRQVIQLQLPVEQLQTMSTPPMYMDGYEMGTDPAMERGMQSWARNVWGVFHVGDQAPNKAGSSQVQFLPATTLSMWCGSQANCEWVQDILDGTKPLRLQLFNAHSGFMQTVELAAQKIKSEDDSDGQKKPAAKPTTTKKDQSKKK